MKAFAHGKCEMVGSIHGDLILVTSGHMLIGFYSPFRGLASNSTVTRSTHRHDGILICRNGPQKLPSPVPEGTWQPRPGRECRESPWVLNPAMRGWLRQ